jgi:hypothetical protein
MNHDIKAPRKGSSSKLSCPWTISTLARAEIWKSWRETCAPNNNHLQAAELFNPDELPAFHDPFAGTAPFHCRHSD